MKLPPLNPLKAFEAAARHESFQLAALELNVTPGAISRQVKALEDYLGFALFTRIHNGIGLTEDARVYQVAVRQALLIIEDSTRQIVGVRREGTLKVWCSQLFLQQWLMPRLHRYYIDHPGHEVELISGRSKQPMPTDIDFAIRFGFEHDWANWQSHYLMGCTLTPVCTPDYAERHPPLEHPADTLGHTLIYNAGIDRDDWNIWLKAAGIDDYNVSARIRLNGDGLTHRAALNGLGLAMGRLEFVQNDLLSNVLVAPFSQKVRLDGAFYAIYPTSYRYPTKLTIFRDWILKELPSQTQAPIEN